MHLTQIYLPLPPGGSDTSGNNRGAGSAARRIEDWTTLTGATVEIRKGNSVLCTGTVDVVTPDGGILWLRPWGDCRRLYEKDASYEAWVHEILKGQ